MNTLKLNNLESSSLSKKEMNLINGGDARVCVCACQFEGTPGGSSTQDNKMANYNLGPRGGYSDVEGAKEAYDHYHDKYD